MSEGIFRCHTFLAVIAIVLYAEALIETPWKPSPADKPCFWKRTGDGYELNYQSNSTHFRRYAFVTTEYQLEQQEKSYEPVEFCISYNIHHFEYSKLDLRIDYEIGFKVFTIEKSDTNCIQYQDSSISLITVTFNATCSYNDMLRPLPKLELPIKARISEDTVSPTENGDPTSDVGDIQYVGVVVGAICIALFTLFSCLTIVSARRSNQRESRRRTIPSASCPDEDDNRPDVVANNAPPSYDAVMACPDLYPPTPLGTPHGSPHGTPETTPHLSLHRRALLNQHTGALASNSASASPQLQRQSYTSTVASDDWEEIPEYPPPPYPGLANADVSTAISEDTTHDTTELENPQEGTPGVNNPVVSTSTSDDSRPSSPDRNSSLPGGDPVNPWVLNNMGNNYLRDRDNYPTIENSVDQYPLRERTRDADSTNSNEDSQGGSTTRTNSPVDDPTESTLEDRVPKPIMESGPANISVRVAVV